jgi:RNA polymerase sigma-70 factor (ECF subfamily)
MQNVLAPDWGILLAAVEEPLAPAARGRTATPELSDEVLMQHYRDGDEAAFRSLYSRHRAPLLRFARHLTGGSGEADEVFQETWLAVIKTRSRYTVRANFVTWLFSIAHRRAADGFRRRARRPWSTGSEASAVLESTPADPVDEPPAMTLHAARQRALDAAIAALPFEQREVFLLRAQIGLGVRDIAALTHTNAETTKSRLRYALRALRKAMASWA